MGGLKKRGLMLGLLLSVAGIVIQLTPRVSAATMHSEEWLTQLAPVEAGRFNVSDSYKMDAATYKELRPQGIIAQKFSSGSASFDVVIVASNRKESFHDPRVCFTAQGWNIGSQEQRVIETARGSIPMTVAKMSQNGSAPRLTAFCYKGPGGFYATPQKLAFSWLMKQIQGQTDTEAVFYRFIPEWDGATEDQLFEFVRDYMAAAEKSSNGYF